MHGGHREWTQLRLEESPSVTAHAERGSEDRLCRGGAETHQDARLDLGQLVLQPGATGGDLPFSRSGVLSIGSMGF